MKEPYFTNQTVNSNAEKMIGNLNKYSQTDRLTFDPEKAALLILDMQRYFLNPSSHAFVPSGTAIVQGIINLAKKMIHKKRPVILTRHVNTPDDTGMLSIWWRDLILEDNPDSNLIPEFENLNGTVIHKMQYDAFYKTDLENILKSGNVSQVIITGVMTHLCCETTARSAFVRGFQVFFPVGGTATYNQQFHEATLLNLSHGFAQPCLMRDLLSRLEENDHAR